MFFCLFKTLSVYYKSVKRQNQKERDDYKGYGYEESERKAQKGEYFKGYKSTEDNDRPRCSKQKADNSVEFLFLHGV